MIIFVTSQSSLSFLFYIILEIHFCGVNGLKQDLCSQLQFVSYHKGINTGEKVAKAKSLGLIEFFVIGVGQLCYHQT